MSHMRIAVVVALALVLAGGGLYVVKQQPKQIEKYEVIQNTTSPRYVHYSKAIFDQVTNKRRVLYFYATWCPTCKTANADFTQNSHKIPGDMIIIRVNYNDPDTDQDEKDLAKQYSITYQHTFVQIDTQGNQMAIWNGGQTDELLLNSK